MTLRFFFAFEENALSTNSTRASSFFLFGISLFDYRLAFFWAVQLALGGPARNNLSFFTRHTPASASLIASETVFVCSVKSH